MAGPNKVKEKELSGRSNLSQVQSSPVRSSRSGDRGKNDDVSSSDMLTTIMLQKHNDNNLIQKELKAKKHMQQHQSFMNISMTKMMDENQKG